MSAWTKLLCKPLAVLELCDIGCKGDAPDALVAQLSAGGLCRALINVHNCHRSACLSQSMCKGSANPLAATWSQIKQI